MANLLLQANYKVSDIKIPPVFDGVDNFVGIVGLEGDPSVDAEVIRLPARLPSVLIELLEALADARVGL